MKIQTFINNIKFSKKQYDLIRPFLLEKREEGENNGMNVPKKGLVITGAKLRTDQLFQLLKLNS